MKKKYETPEIEIMMLDPEMDIIRTSGGGDSEITLPGGEIGGGGIEW